jgi:hypothetical protein
MDDPTMGRYSSNNYNNNNNNNNNGNQMAPPNPTWATQQQLQPVSYSMAQSLPEMVHNLNTFMQQQLLLQHHQQATASAAALSSSSSSYAMNQNNNNHTNHYYQNQHLYQLGQNVQFNLNNNRNGNDAD